jgi:hypothetical protein
VNLELAKKVCRIIVEANEVLTDEYWERKWAWHTDPESVRLGGEWWVLASARKIIDLVRSDG